MVNNGHCYVINLSNFYSAVYFLNALTTVTEAHAVSLGTMVGCWRSEIS